MLHCVQHAFACVWAGRTPPRATPVVPTASTRARPSSSSATVLGALRPPICCFAVRNIARSLAFAAGAPHVSTCTYSYTFVVLNLCHVLFSYATVSHDLLSTPVAKVDRTKASLYASKATRHHAFRHGTASAPLILGFPVAPS